jgi:hypothetical protein
MSVASVVPGALFRLPDGRTGIVFDVHCNGVWWSDKNGRKQEVTTIDAIAPHIICEPGNGPVRGNDSALADAQARAVRMKAERDAARAQAASLQAALDQAALYLPAAIAAAIEQREAEYRAGIDALAGERDRAIAERDEARKLLAAVSNAQVDTTEERDKARRELANTIEERDEALRRAFCDDATDAQPVTASVTIGGRTVTLTIGATP